MTQRNNSFQVKNYFEKEAYKDFLKDSLPVNERTEEKEEDTKKTNSSTFEKDNPSPEKKKSGLPPKKKSFWLRCKDKDFLTSNFTFPLIVIIVGAFILAGFNLFFDVRDQKVQVSDLKTNLGSEHTKVDNLQSDFNDLNLDFSTFKVETRKDIEFIKDKLK